MATFDQVAEPSELTIDPILRVFQDTGEKLIPSAIYDIQSNADAFRYASTLEKRCRLFDDLVRSNRFGLVTALACTLSQEMRACMLIASGRR